MAGTFVSDMEFPLQLWSMDELRVGEDNTFTNVLHFNLLKRASAPSSASDEDLNFDSVSADFINTLDESQGAAPLHYASMHGNLNMVTFLVEHGADVDILDGNKKVTPLACAAAFGHLSVAKFLVTNGCDVNAGLNNFSPEYRPPLVWAVKANHPEIVRYLLDNSVTQNSPIPFSETPIHTAVMSGCTEILEMLIKAQGKNVKADFHMGESKNTPLHLAASGQYPNSLEICKILVEQGYVEINALNTSEKTPLHESAESHNEQVCKFLLCQWAKVDAVDKHGKTPLFYTINDSEYALKCMETLIIRGGCDINHKDKQGNTPLHIAAINGTAFAAEVLLLNGADFSIKSGSTTALRMLNRKIPDLQEILIRVFDSAVTVTCFPESGTGENRQDCKVKVNYKYVLPATSHQTFGDSSSNNQQNNKNRSGGARMGFLDSKDTEGGEDGKIPIILGRKETAKMKCLVEEGLACLLTHPVIHSFLELKWNKAKYVFFPTLILKGIFLLLFSLYVEMPYILSGALIHGNENIEIPSFDNETHGYNVPIYLDPPAPTPTWFTVMYFGVVTLAALKGIIEILQIVRSPKTQLRTAHPWISWTVLLIVGYMSPISSDNPWNRKADPLQRSVAAIGILLAWVDIWIDMGRFPIVGLSIRVFFQVFKNFGRFMLPHFCLLTGFVLSFTLLMPENTEFLNIPFTLTKIVRIMAGDITIVKEGTDNWTTKRPSWKEFTTRMLLLYIYTSYVVIVAIVLGNLLIGLAANDIQSIYTHAAMDKLTNQTILINTLESNFGGRWTRTCLPQRLFEKCTTNLFHPGAQNKVLTFKPYDSRDAKLNKDLKMALFETANTKMEQESTSKVDSEEADDTVTAPSKNIQQWKMAVKKVKKLKTNDDDEKVLMEMLGKVVTKFMAEKKSKLQLAKIKRNTTSTSK